MPGSSQAWVGVLRDDVMTELATVTSLGELLRLPLSTLRPLVSGADGAQWPLPEVSLPPPTGTCLVPDAPVTLEPGDAVKITVGEVGTLTNHVVRGVGEMTWLVEARDGARRARPNGVAL